jgi:predicted lipid-binding transport protein (Tim44 family)
MGFAFDILIFAVIAVFLWFKLRGTLGQHHGDDEIKRPPSVLPPVANDTRPLSPADKAAPNAPLGKTTEDSGAWPTPLPDFKIVSTATVHDRLLQVHALDAKFHPAEFLDGAMRAYDIILHAHAKGDRTTLAMLVAPALLKKFEKTMPTSATTAADVSRETRLPELQKALISAALVRGTTAWLTVTFTAQQVLGPQEIDTIREGWKFQRDLKSGQDIWILTSIEAVDEA